MMVSGWKRVIAGAVAALVGLAGMALAAPVPVAAAAPEVLLVVGQVPLSAPDAAVQTDLEAAGFGVVAIDDDVVATADAAGRAVVVISSTVVPSKIGSMFTGVGVGVVAWEAFLFDDLELVPGAFFQGETAPTNRVTITEPSHPIADGLSGQPFVTTLNRSQSFARNAFGTTVATSNANGAPVIVAADTGDPLNTGVAPARRVAMFLAWNSGTHLNANGTALLVNAVTWAADLSGPTNASPVVDAGPDQTLTAPDLTTTLAGSVTDDNVTGPPTISWAPIAGVSFTDPGAVDTDVTFDGPGIYELTLTADDGDFVVSGTVTVTVRSERPQIGFVSGRANGTPADRAIIARIEAAGAEVTIIDDDNAATFDPATVDALFISSTVVLSKVGDTFKHVALPIAIWEAYLFDDMGLAIRSRETAADTRINITDPGHPITNGLTGTTTVLTTPRPLSVAILGGDGHSIAHQPSSPGRSTLFSYNFGDELADGTTAPQLRIGLFPDYLSGQHLTTIGQIIIDNTIDHIINSTGPTPYLGTIAGSGNGDRGNAVGVDGDGNTYIAGLAQGEADFDFGPGTTNYTPAKRNFLAKYNPLGELVWVTDIGTGPGFGSANPADLAVDDNGAVYVVGNMSGTVDFDPGPGTANLTATGGFVAKFDTDGNLVWADVITSSGFTDIRAVAVDHAGVYLTGNFNAPTDFDTGPGTATATPVGLNDAFVLALNPTDGTFNWVNTFGSQSPDGGQSIAVNNGIISVGGSHQAAMSIEGTTLSHAGGEELFVVSYTNTGDFQWAVGFGNVGSGQGRGVGIDNDNNTYIATYFQGTLTIGTTTLTASTPSTLIVKYDASGSVVWAKQIGGTGRAFPEALDVSDGVIGITGVYRQGTIDLDPGPGTRTITNNDDFETDVFVATYDTDGNLTGASTFAGPDYDWPEDAAIGPDGSVHVTGYFRQSTTFNIGLGTPPTATAIAPNGNLYLAKVQPA